jgi:hypothetical protein
LQAGFLTAGFGMLPAGGVFDEVGIFRYIASNRECSPLLRDCLRPPACHRLPAMQRLASRCCHNPGQFEGFSARTVTPK